MRITVSIDSFKGSLSTIQAGEATAEGIRRAYPDAEVLVKPLADGGEGTADAIITALNGEWVDVTVHNPLGDLIQSRYGIIPSSKTAVVEIAAAAGITLISEEERNPLNTTTFGVGEIILDALSRGCRRFIVGLGGSATNDGGVGMLQALGFRFLDCCGKQVPFGANGLKDIVEIKTDGAVKELADCSFFVACDVKNTLCGENGCSAVYGPQKGATPQMVKEMDNSLKNYAELTEALIPQADASISGTGAAGGLGFAFLAYLNAKLESGIDLLIKETGLEKYIEGSDIVITGEGRLDGQSCMGKAPVGIARLAKKYDIPVIAFSGCVTAEAKACNEYGIDAFFPIVKAPCTLSEAMKYENAYKNLSDTAEQVFRLIKQIRFMRG